jgi:WD40 repeat protein
MKLDHTLHHHTSGVNTVALSPEGDRLLSGGESKPSTMENHSTQHCTGDDVDIVVWNILTGEKVQVVSCAFHGPVGALVWIPEQPGLVLGFAFGCANGSIHIYQRCESSVCDHATLISGSELTPIFQSNYQYFTQGSVHNGPIMDLKFDAQFGRLASVSNGFLQVSQLLTTGNGEHFFSF